MANSGLKHIDVGSELSKSEWESEESHELVHGNSFPGSPVERQLFYRDDEHKWYIYNGSEWLCLQTAAMEVHGNEYHDPDFEQEGVAASLVESHRTTETHTQPQPAAEHGNEKHNPDFATESALSSHETAATGVHGVGSGTVGIKDKDSVIQDADGDTKWQMEESADEDIARLDVAGIERASLGDAKGNKTANHWLFVSDDGIASFPKQSAALLVATASQWLRNNQATFARLNAEDFDVQGEGDASVVSGTNTDIATNKLIDSGANFVAGDLGRHVWNKSDNTYAKVTNVDSSTQLTLDADIFPSPAGDDYELYHSKVTVKESGKYLASGGVRLNNAGGTGRMAIQIYKNGVGFVQSETRVVAGMYPSATVVCCIDLAADDYVQLVPYPVTGSVEDTFIGVRGVFLSVAKVG